MVYQKKNPERKRYMHLTDLTPQVIDTLIGDISPLSTSFKQY
jgi:hypothetical protein